MKLLLQLLIIAIFTSFSISVFGQNATIRGSVFEKSTGQPVLYTNVYLKGTNHGAVTDVNGYFTISKVPQGKYLLMVSYIGFDTLSKENSKLLAKATFISHFQNNLSKKVFSS